MHYLLGSVLSVSLLSTAPQTPQYTDAELERATISMRRENRCGFVRLDLTDIRQCPTYTVTIFGDGTVTYEGKAGVRTLGTRSHHIDPTEVADLIGEIVRAQFFSLDDRYDRIIEANGGWRTIEHAIATTLSVGVGGQKKQVFDFHGTPDAVLRLEERVDTVSDSQRYTGRQPPRLQPSAAGVR